MTIFPKNIRSISKPIISLFGCLFLLVISGCGGRTLESVQITPTSADLVGIGATQQLTVTATYSNGDKFNVTGQSKFLVATPNPLGPFTPDNAVTVNGSGQAQAVLGACTWQSSGGTNGAPLTFTTAPYVVTATFDGLSGTTFMSVASAGNCLHP